MRSLTRRKSMIYLLLLNGVVFSIIVTVLLKKDQYLKCDCTTSLLAKNNESLALKLTAQNPSPTKEHARPHRTYLTSRTRCTQNVFLLIVVFSAPAHSDRRTVIRKTWATDPSVKTRWKTVFLLGRAVGNSIENEYLEAEGMTHKDLIRGAQNEHYNNLTLKTQMGLEWASKYCEFQFLVKADDDVFVNPYTLMDFLGKPDTPKTEFYTGLCFHEGRPLREGKNAISWEEYNKTAYADFCVGPAYLLSSDLVHKLVKMFDVSKKPFKLEDVYIGQLVDAIGGVKAVRNPLFRLHEFGHCTHSSDTFAYHPASVHCIEELFNAAMKERAEHELAQLRSKKTAGRNHTKH